MAISPEWHRHGIGKAMIHRLASDLRLDHCQLLQVKTLGPSRPDRHYAATRASTSPWATYPWWCS
jgi:GNAT superfamily N-acetyltransferase